MDWLQVAKELPVGRTTRRRHDCNPQGEASLVISNEPECYRAYCFRCKEAGMFESKQLSLAERVEINRKRREADAGVAREAAPQPAVYDWLNWPSEAMAWLLKAGLGFTESRVIGAYYHPPTQRVVIPYMGTDHWQARAVMKGHKPKYLSSKGERVARILYPVHSNGDVVVLTEDLLSAYKLYFAGVDALPLLGTQLHDEHLVALLKRDRPVHVWLDPDAAGQRAAKDIRARLVKFGFAVNNILSDRDPKLHTYQDIRRIIEETTA